MAARNMYQDALDSQSACNASGLIHSLPDIAKAVWKEIHAGTWKNGFNKHPVIILFVYQLSFLAGGDDMGKWQEAYSICQQKARLAA